MPYPTKEEFARIVLSRDSEQIIDEYLFSGLPYAYRSNADDYSTLLTHLETSLEVDQQHITVVGSGRIGFSLDPDRFGIPFRESSDIDVVVVSSELFDRVWIDLLRLSPTRFRGLPWPVRAKLRENIYWGRLWPDQLVGVTPVSLVWFNAFKGVSRFPRLAQRDVKGRLYRLWDHARLYHSYGLKQISAMLQREAR